MIVHRRSKTYGFKNILNDGAERFNAPANVYTKTLSQPIQVEKHFCAAFYAEFWGVSKDTIIRWFQDKPGVLKGGFFTVAAATARPVKQRYERAHRLDSSSSLCKKKVHQDFELLSNRLVQSPFYYEEK